MKFGHNDSNCYSPSATIGHGADPDTPTAVNPGATIARCDMRDPIVSDLDTVEYESAWWLFPSLAGFELSGAGSNTRALTKTIRVRSLMSGALYTAPARMQRHSLGSMAAHLKQPRLITEVGSSGGGQRPLFLMACTPQITAH